MSEKRKTLQEMRVEHTVKFLDSQIEWLTKQMDEQRNADGKEYSSDFEKVVLCHCIRGLLTGENNMNLDLRDCEQYDKFWLL